MKEFFKFKKATLILFIFLAAGCFGNSQKLKLEQKLADSELDKAVISSLNKNIDKGHPQDWTSSCNYNKAYVVNVPGKTDVYVMASCSFDYHTKDDQGQPIIGGVGVPVHMQFSNQKGVYQLTEFQEPNDASVMEDRKKMFPKEYLDSIDE